MKIGIVGYGNLGRALEKVALERREFETLAIFSRRRVSARGASVFSMDEMLKFKGEIDCLLLAGGSSSDLPTLSPGLVADFNIVDSFDNHTEIRAHYERVNVVARKSGHVGIISCGWDPGLFSVFRHISKSFFPNAEISSFWGEGVSQGHSEAIRRINGVKYAVQYTVPKIKAIEAALSGNPPQDIKKTHKRVCYVVANEDHRAEIAEEIKNIPAYFKGYEVEVNFISESDFFENHQRLYHEGRVVSFDRGRGKSADISLMDLSVKMSSNPVFTASIMLAFATAAKKLYDKGDFGAKTPIEIPPIFLSSNEGCELL